MAATVGSSAAIFAATLVLETSWTAMSGRCFFNHCRHWAMGCGWETTNLMSSILPDLLTRLWMMPRFNSPQILTLYLMKESRVEVTAPSMEFSTGTMPYWVLPRSTSSKMSSMVSRGRYLAECPKYFIPAKWEKVASGPRYATATFFCERRQVVMISWKMLR